NAPPGRPYEPIRNRNDATAPTPASAITNARISHCTMAGSVPAEPGRKPPERAAPLRRERAACASRPPPLAPGASISTPTAVRLSTSMLSKKVSVIGLRSERPGMDESRLRPPTLTVPIAPWLLLRLGGSARAIGPGADDAGMLGRMLAPHLGHDT